MRGLDIVGLSAVLTLSAGLALSGCAGALYFDHPFDGVEPLVAAAKPGDPVRVFVIHGITKQNDDYADAFAEDLSRKLALDLRGAEHGYENEQFPVPDAIGEGATPPQINLRTYHLRDAAGLERVRVAALNWSPLTEGIKLQQFQADGQVSRAVINDEIKTKLVDDGLSDAVLYLGKYKRVMSDGVMIGLCSFLDGWMVGKRCVPRRQSQSDVVLVSESLGSMMLLDAIDRLKRQGDRSGEPQLIQRMRRFYMFANQLPLLELRSKGGQTKERTQFQLFLDEVQAVHARALQLNTADRALGAAPTTPPPPLQVVAFTDPNDLLSYDLGPKNLDPSGRPELGYSLSNVLYPVAQSWFGLFANPIKAHTGYATDPEVLRLVTCGAAGCNSL